MRALRGVGRLALQGALVTLLREGALRLLAPHPPALAPLLSLPNLRGRPGAHRIAVFGDSFASPSGGAVAAAQALAAALADRVPAARGEAP